MTIDINMDVGEGLNNEAELFPYISSCNIACGGHAGNPQSMSEVMTLAKEFNVKVGAHPSYPDLENFGRKVMFISDKALSASIQSQLKDFITIAKKLNIQPHHIKAHGALYNKAAKDKDTALLFLNTIKGFELPIYAPFNSQLAKMAITQGVHVYFESFADRRYNADLSLVSRTDSRALITDIHTMLDQVKSILSSNQVKTISGVFKTIKADTICLHSDSPQAALLVQQLYKQLSKDGYTIA